MKKKRIHTCECCGYAWACPDQIFCGVSKGLSAVCPRCTENLCEPPADWVKLNASVVPQRLVCTHCGSECTLPVTLGDRFLRLSEYTALLKNFKREHFDCEKPQND